MRHTTIAILLSLMFTTLTVAPDIMVLMDHDYDVSVLIDSSEEEERKGEEKVKDFKIKIPTHFFLNYASYCNQELESLLMHIDNYSSIVKELNSPPPEVNI